MSLDLGDQGRVTAGNRHAQVQPGLGLVQPGALQKVGVLGLEQEVVGLCILGQRDPGADLDHVGVHARQPRLAGDRHPVVAVDHEVGIAHLVDRDGRQVAALDDGVLDARPGDPGPGPHGA